MVRAIRVSPTGGRRTWISLSKMMFGTVSSGWGRASNFEMILKNCTVFGSENFVSRGLGRVLKAPSVEQKIRKIFLNPKLIFHPRQRVGWARINDLGWYWTFEKLVKMSHFGQFLPLNAKIKEKDRFLAFFLFSESISGVKITS